MTFVGAFKSSFPTLSLYSCCSLTDAAMIYQIVLQLVWMFLHKVCFRQKIHIRSILDYFDTDVVRGNWLLRKAPPMNSMPGFFHTFTKFIFPIPFSCRFFDCISSSLPIENTVLWPKQQVQNLGEKRVFSPLFPLSKVWFMLI